MSFVCVICEESLAFRDPAIANGPESVHVQVTSTLCGHIFHQHCLKDWFTCQARKLSESHNPRVRSQIYTHCKTTCPSCQRPVDFNTCIRVFPTEDGNESFNVHNNNIKTKAMLTEEINELAKMIEKFEHEKRISGSVETRFRNTIENLSEEKATLASELRKLKVQLEMKNLGTGGETFSVPSDSQEQEESLNDLGPVEILDDTHDTESLNEFSTAEEDPSSGEESLPPPKRTQAVNAAAVAPNQEEIETLVATTGGLTTGDIVVWMREDDNEIGAVLWIGYISGVLSAGVKFINPIGNSSGEINGQKVFSCDINYGRIIAVRELIMYNDFFGTNANVNLVEW